MEVKRIKRSSTDRVLFGVCGGLAEYFEVDSLVVRLLFVLLTILVGSGLLLYLVCALLIPSEEKAAREAEASRAYYAQSGQGSYTAPHAQSAQSYSYRTAADPQPQAASEAEPVSYQDRAAYAAPEAKTTIRVDEAPKAESAQNAGAQSSPFRTMPQQPHESAQQKQERARQAAYGGYHEAPRNTTFTERAPQARRDSKVVGLILVAIGGLILLKYFIPRISTTVVFAVLCIAAGLYFILRRK